MTLVVGLTAASKVAERRAEVGWHIRMLLPQSRQEVRVGRWVEVKSVIRGPVQDAN